MRDEPVRGWKRWLWPLRSRKMQVAVATIVVTYAAHAGLMLSEETVVTVLGVGVALILGIAHEDSGRAAGATRRP
ncbi:MAG TPA: hypothetical protein VM487_19390 [Phycisphaerae bacterium]|nr:hypothetical protein [Phycisphaerae bacterium]